MMTNHPGSYPRSFQQTTHSHFQWQEKDASFLRHNMPPTSSSRRTQRCNPDVAQKVGQPQGVPRTSDGQFPPRGGSFHPSEAQIHKMTFEQVVSSILQFLGKDPLYMASVDPNHHGQSKPRKRKQNSKLLETTNQAPKKRTQKTKQANAIAIQPANNSNHQETTTDEQIRAKALETSLFTSSNQDPAFIWGLRPGDSRGNYCY